MNEHTIKEALLKGERLTMECKRCENKLPNSLWDTYSAFANSYGGKNSSNVVVDAVVEELTERQLFIYKFIKQSVVDGVVENLSARTIAEVMKVSHRTIQRELSFLQSKNLIRRVGPDNGGHWEIIDN